MNGIHQSAMNQKLPFVQGTECFFLKTLALSLMLLGSQVHALPAGGVVTVGGATISGNSATITQSSQNVAINWQGFSIGAGEAVRFIQPNSSSVALNRVLGADPSSIFGSISANGKVFLVNPNGILFGRGSSVNVGGLVASTLNITDSDFMAGNYKFANNSNAAVSNQGTINADGGYVALLGANVSNEGTLIVRLGTVALAAGNAITLDVAGDGLLNVTVNEGAVNALVQNGDLIQADGGHVLLTTQAAGSLLQTVVNNTGVIRAQTIENRNGTIMLLGDMQSGTTNVGGTLDASAPNGGNGGFIETSAAHVKVLDSARITTAAPYGLTGTWLIDPVDYTIAIAGGDISGAQLSANLLASNITISSNDGHNGTSGDINVNAEIHWAGATTLMLNAVHNVRVNAPITAETAGARLILTAENDVIAASLLHAVAAGSSIRIRAENDIVVAAITGTAANTAVNLSAGHDIVTTDPIHVVAADSSILISGGNDVLVGGPITATAANSSINLVVGRDAVVSAPITVVAADSLISVVAGRDVATTATLTTVAATSIINLNAGRNVSVNAALTAGAAGSVARMTAGHDINVNAAIAAGSTVSLVAGNDGSGPGAAGGTVRFLGAGGVAAPNVSLRFNPNGYTNTASEIGAFGMKVAGILETKAWVFAQGNNKQYDGTTAASINGIIALPSLVLGPVAHPVFDTKDAGLNKSITFGSTFTDPVYALFAPFGAAAGTGVGRSSITPAPLTVTAADVTKIYGETPRLSAFTVTGLLQGETFGTFNIASPGAAATASVTGSPYAITPSGPGIGGTSIASNYAIRYVNGALTVRPLLHPESAGVTSVRPVTALAGTLTDWMPSIVPADMPDELRDISPD